MAEIFRFGCGSTGRTGEFEANRLGAFTVKVRAGGREAAVRVLVVPETGVRPVGTLTRLTSSRTGLGPVVASTDTPPVTTQPVKGGAANGQAKGEEVQINNLLPGDGWNDGNWMSADDPGNETGNPPGGPADDGAGNGNFQISAPVVSLPGRGIDLALNLNYNSRVWNKAVGSMSIEAI